MIRSTYKHKLQIYHTYKKSLIKLYTEAFYNNESNALLSHNIESYFDRIMRQGVGVFCFENGKLSGALMATPPDFDHHLPAQISREIVPARSLYIAEVFVSETCRNKGYGKQLMNELFILTKEDYDTYIIRVLSTNEAAIKLYKKCEFIPKTTIIERKTDHNQNKIALEKLYLVKKTH